MSKFVIFLLLSVALARAAPSLEDSLQDHINYQDDRFLNGGEFPTAISSTPSSNGVDFLTDINNGTKQNLPHHASKNIEEHTNQRAMNKYISFYRHFSLTKNEEIILVIGNSGSGKTTVSSLLTRANLTAEEDHEGFYPFNITDEKQLVHSPFQNRTTYRLNVFTNEQYNTTFYDTPGFAETTKTRCKASLEMHGNLSLPFTKSVKILLVVDHISVQFGAPRIGFHEVLNHFGIAVNDADRYGDAIAMIVNKVPNTCTNNNGSCEVVSDDQVIQQVVRYLKHIKEQLKGLNQLEWIPMEHRAFNEHKVRLIDILLKHDNSSSGNTYERIGILRVPKEAGPIADMELFVNEKEQIQHIVQDNLKFAAIK